MRAKRKANFSLARWPTAIGRREMKLPASKLRERMPRGGFMSHQFRWNFIPALLIFIVCAFAAVTRAQESHAEWRFAVSGDSRNCGDVVMPGIAAGVIGHHAAFYWHLGDFRKIYDFDEDMQHEPEHLAKPLTISDYLATAWPDFIDNQLIPFGSLPVFLSLGNHETVPPKTRQELIPQIADWLDAPVIREQRLRDDPRDHLLKTYYHWIMNGIDFINLDNATPDQFDHAQMTWFEKVIARDEANAGIVTIVVGSHEALPDSISAGHSMNESPAGTDSGRRVYIDLLRVQNESHKRVYILASHSHYYMDNIFNTQYWNTHGGVLPGWIIGTAGAVRYALPEKASDARAAMTNVYGYLVATVSPEGEIRFEFEKLSESDIPVTVISRFTPEFVHWCFVENSSAH
jgi:Calcineurin-like phosphoesterase